MEKNDAIYDIFTENMTKNNFGPRVRKKIDKVSFAMGRWGT